MEGKDEAAIEEKVGFADTISALVAFLCSNLCTIFS